MTNVKPSKKTLGRRKIQLKKIENKSNLQVTFTKRRTGLFKKASELSVLCGAEIAILVQSPANKIFSFGNPCVLHRYQTGFSTTELEIEDNYYTRNEYDEAVQKLEMKKKSLLMDSSSSSSSSSTWKTENRFWWDATSEVENMEELEEYMEALEGLKSNVLHRVDDQEQKIAEYANDLASCCFSSSNLLPPKFSKNNCDFNYTTSDSQFDFINGSVEHFDVSSFLDILDLDIADLNN